MFLKLCYLVLQLVIHNHPDTMMSARPTVSSREKINRILAARQKEGHPEMSGRGHLHSRVLSDDNFIQVFIGDRECEALIDTGATSSVVGREFFTLRESDNISVFPTHHQCMFAGGSTVAADCQLHMKIRIDGKDIEHIKGKSNVVADALSRPEEEDLVNIISPGVKSYIEKCLELNQITASPEVITRGDMVSTIGELYKELSEDVCCLEQGSIKTNDQSHREGAIDPGMTVQLGQLKGHKNPNNV